MPNLADPSGDVEPGAPRAPTSAEEYLAEQRHAFMRAANPAMFYSFHPLREDRIVFLRGCSGEYLGYTASDIGPDPMSFWITHIHPEDNLRAYRALRSVIERGHRICEYRFLHKDGRYRWLRDEAQLIKDKDGNLLEVMGCLIDISERKHVEEELKRRARQLAEAQSVAHIGSWDWDIEHDSVEWSDEHYRIFGVEPGTLRLSYKSVLRMVHPEDRDRLRDAVARSLEGVRPYQTEVRIVRPDGGERQISLRGVVVRNAAGQPIRMHGTVQDITERKRAGDALRRSEDRFAAFMANLPGAALIRDATGRYIYANSTATLKQAPSDSWVGKTIEDAFPPEVAARVRESDREVLRTGQVVRTIEQTNFDGDTRYWLINKFPLLGNGARMNLVGGVGIDITEQKRVEEELRKSEQRLRTMLEERQHLMQDLHDDIIQTIYAVGFGLEECQRLITEDQRGDAVQAIGNAIGCLNQAIRSMRRFIGGSDTERMDPNDLAAELSELARRVDAAKLLELRVNVDPNAAAGLTSDQARHILCIAREAMSNSLRHSGAKTATVKLHARRARIRFEIADDGVGFDLDHISARGQGLKNIAARANLIGAQLEMTSACGAGTRIVLDLPHEGAHANQQRRRTSASHRR